MQDLSSEDEKIPPKNYQIPPKNYQIPPKNYPRIVFGCFLAGFSPVRFSKIP